MACGLASLGLHAATEGDVRIFKVILLSRAVTVGLRMLGKETGLFTPIAEQATDEKRSFIVESAVVTFFGMVISYTFLFHHTA